MHTTPSVLVVEDDDSFRALLRAWVGVRADLRFAGTVAEATVLLDGTDHYDVAFVDQRLPDGDGEELIELIRTSSRRAAMPVIMMSGADLEPADRVRILRSGADDFIDKSIGAEEFTARLHAHLLRSRRLEAAIGELDEDHERLVAAAIRAGRSADGVVQAALDTPALFAGVHGVIDATVVNPAEISHPLAGMAARAIRGTLVPSVSPQEAAAFGGVAGQLVCVPLLVGTVHLVLVVAHDPALISADRVAGIGHTASSILHGLDPDADGAAIDPLIERGGLLPVFHPIVDGNGNTIGVEALTRMDDGTPPAKWFAGARRAGRVVDAELSAVAVQARAAEALPGSVWLSVNLSPRTLVDPRLPGVWPEERATVVELTEHLPVLDYPRLTKAIGTLPGTPRVAIDDAGAGYSCLSHVLRLRPHFVKLDRSWTNGITTDPAKQALVIGVKHFADEIGSTVIAEGVETTAQLAALRHLGVTHTQGFLYGHPAPADQIATSYPFARSDAY